MIDTALIKESGLKRVADKVISGEPVNSDDALAMLSTTDIPGLGMIANFIREKINGNLTYYGMNVNLNYTNSFLKNSI